MYWTVDSSGLRIDVVRQLSITKDYGLWSAIGFSNSGAGQMPNTDAIIYPYNSTLLVATPYFISGTRGLLDMNPSKVSIRNTTSMNFPSYNVWGFTRNLNDGNNLINTATYNVYMVAVASTGEYFTDNKKHELFTIGADTVNLATGVVTPPGFVWTEIVTHGFLMWICWCIITPAGFLWARFIKGTSYDKDALWFEGHRMMMSIAFIILIISASLGIGLSATHVDNTHKIMGITVVAGALYQVMSAVMRPHADPKNPTLQRLIFEYTHHLIGRLSILTAWVTIGFGLVLVTGISLTIVYIHSVICAVWFSLWIVLEIGKYIASKRKSVHEYDPLPHK